MTIHTRSAGRVGDDSEHGVKSALLFAFVLTLFFISGACGLLYQVVWTRKLVLVFGTTSYAVSAVLSIFFLGLGAGSLWGGRIADRTRRPLFIYGAFEVAIGLWALLFIFTINHGEAGLVAILRAFSFSRGAGIALRALLACALLIVPVTLMGASLPLLARFVVRERRERGGRTGALYSVNTFGAVTGCLLTGFVLIARYGYIRTTFIGAAGNVAAGLAAIILAEFLRWRSLRVKAPLIADARHHLEDRETRARLVETLVIAVFAVSGFCALALEVLWTRLLTTVFLGTTYAFTTMLAALLCGIAAGSAAAAPWVVRRRHVVSLFGMAELLIGASCLLTLRVFAWLPGTLQALQVDMAFDWGKVVFAKFALAFAVLFVPAFLFGTTFPLAVACLAPERGRLGRMVGRLYGANTFGGVLGASFGGYMLLPRLGVHGSIVALACVLAGAGAVLVLGCPTRKARKKAAVLASSALVIAGAFWTLPGNIGLALSQWFVPEHERIIHFDEGVEGTVVVSELAHGPAGENRTLWINAVQATATIERGVRMNRLQGALPVVFDRDPSEALFMCFGSGVTAGTLTLFDYDRIDAVEISPGVLEAAKLFERDNLGVIDNEKVRFIVDDGRNFLLTTEKTYDVITFEPMPLAIAGVSTFYTREYYELCLARLNPGGIVSQWVPLHSLSPELVRALVRTFAAVFPHHCAWFINADLFLIGSDEPMRIDYAQLEARMAAPQVREALSRVSLAELPELLACYFMGAHAMAAYAGQGPVMTDDRPWAEFAAPKLVAERNVRPALEELIPHYEPALLITDLSELPQDNAENVREAILRRYEARKIALEGLKRYYGGGMGSHPERWFRDALAVDPQDQTAQYYLRQIALARARVALREEEWDAAIGELRPCLRFSEEDPEVRLLLADAYYGKGDKDAAKAHYQAHIALGGREPRARERLTASSGG